MDFSEKGLDKQHKIQIGCLRITWKRRWKYFKYIIEELRTQHISAGGGRLGSRGVPTVAHQSDLQRKTATFKDRGQPLKPTVFFYLKS